MSRTYRGAKGQLRDSDSKHKIVFGSARGGKLNTWDDIGAGRNRTRCKRTANKQIRQQLGFLATEGIAEWNGIQNEYWYDSDYDSQEEQNYYLNYDISITGLIPRVEFKGVPLWQFQEHYQEKDYGFCYIERADEQYDY